MKERNIQEAENVAAEVSQEESEDIIGELLLGKLLDEEGKRVRQTDVEDVETDFMEQLTDIFSYLRCLSMLYDLLNV